MSALLKYVILTLLLLSLTSCGDSESPFISSDGNTSGGGSGGGSGPGAPPPPNNLSNVQLKTTFLTTEASGHARNVLQSDDGTIIIFSAQFDNGSNPDNIEQIFSIVGSSVTQISSFTQTNPGMNPGSAGAPYTNLALSADGSQITWVSSLDPTGGNAAANRTVFTMQADGTGLLQLITASSGGQIQHTNNEPPAISADGSTVYFVSSGDHNGSNASNLSQIFSIPSAGGGTSQETSNALGLGTTIGWMDVSSGGLIAFSGTGNWDGTNNADGNSEIYSIQTNGAGGTGLLQYTNTTTGAADAGKVAISNDGNTISFVTDRDPTGGNADNSLEIFSIDITGPTVTQLTTDWSTAVYNLDAGMPATGRDMFSMAADGSRIVYVETIPATGLTATNYQARIVSINADGSGQSTIMSTEAGTLTLSEYISYPSANLTANITAFYSNINFQKLSPGQSLMQIYTASQ